MSGRNGFLILNFLLLVALVGCEASPPTVEEISQAEFLESLPPDTMILDVRSEQEFRREHIPNAIHIPHEQLPERLAELGDDPEMPVVVYCESGRRSSIAGQTLLEAGWTNVSHLAGDMRAWREQGRPTAH
jgi:rhodanese-related sulfurtransferase